MVRLNLNLEIVRKQLCSLKKGSSIWHKYKDFHLENPKNRTSLEQVKLVKMVEKHAKTRRGNKF